MIRALLAIAGLLGLGFVLGAVAEWERPFVWRYVED